jgi:hypothetical protein
MFGVCSNQTVNTGRNLPFRLCRRLRKRTARERTNKQSIPSLRINVDRPRHRCSLSSAARQLAIGPKVREGGRLIKCNRPRRGAASVDSATDTTREVSDSPLHLGASTSSSLTLERPDFTFCRHGARKKGVVGIHHSLVEPIDRGAKAGSARGPSPRPATLQVVHHGAP